jgi:hypothetical protein
MFYSDHAPAHFHVHYGGQRAIINIKNLAVIREKLSLKTLALVMEWAALHQDELIENWFLARKEATLHHIAPLK